MENLEQTLAFANYQSTLTTQKRLIKQRFEEACIYPHNGGLFRLTLEFLGGLSTIKEKQWVVDMNSNPIWIDNPIEFYRLSNQLYVDAVTRFGMEYEELKKKRSVKALLGV